MSRNSASRLPALTLTFLIIVTYLCGGGARPDIQSLVVLRPVAAIAIGFGLLTFNREHWVKNRALFLFTGACGLIVGLHLIPLPPGLWSALPGRELIAEAAKAAGMPNHWKTLSIAPSASWNALFSLLVPTAVVILGVQLTADEMYRCVLIIAALALCSAFLGLVQAIGDPRGPLYLYQVTNNGAAVGLFANRNHQALLVAMVFPMLAVIANTRARTVDRRTFARWMAGAVGAALVPLLLVTGSRAGLVLGAVGLGAAFFLFRTTDGDLPTRRRSAPHPVPFPVYALLGVSAIGLLTFALSRAESVRRIVESDSVEELRFQMWPTIWNLALSYLPFGSGAGTFIPAYQIGEPDALLGPNYVNHAHNDALETLLTAGLPGVIMIVIFGDWFFRSVLKMMRHPEPSRRDKAMSWLGATMVFMMSLSSLGDYPLRTPILSATFALAVLWVIKPWQKSLEVTRELV